MFQPQADVMLSFIKFVGAREKTIKDTHRRERRGEERSATVKALPCAPATLAPLSKLFVSAVFRHR
jgi:hypothetical protein